MHQPSEFRKTLIRVLCFFLVFQGYPLMALEGSGRLELSEPAWTWLDEQIEGSLSAAETAWRAVLPVAHAAHFGASGSAPPPPPPPDLEIPEDSVFGPGSDPAPPVPPGFRTPEELPPSLRAFYGEVGTKAGLDSVSLAPGFNLASIPEEPADPDPVQVLAPIGGAFNQVLAYDACDAADPWKLYDPADPAASDLTAIDHKIGFWIDAALPVDLPSDGTLPATTTLQLCVGWNLIGFPAGQPRHVRNALQSIEGKYVRVFGYDPTDAVDPWEIYDVAVPEWANDLDAMRPGRGYWVLVTEAATLEIANDGDAPVVDILSPADLAVITEPTDVIGTVESPVLDEWSLAYRLVGEPEWIELARQSFPVTNAPLASLDTTHLVNGLYELRLQATDFQGQQVEETIAVVVEGDMKIGNFSLSFVDLAIPVSGLDIEIVRTYDSRRRLTEGDFGFGWILDIRQGSYRNNRLPGEGWQIVNPGGPFGLPCTSTLETESHLATIRLSDQEIYYFQPRLVDNATLIGGCQTRVTFELFDAPHPGATLEILGNDLAIYTNGSNELIDVDTLEVFEPENVRLRTRDGRTFDLNLDGGVTRLEDANGNAVDITPAGIQHSSGVGIDFVRDGQGRLTEITDPVGSSLLYGYDPAGDLVSFTDRAGGVSTYAYAAGHYLEDLFNPLGIRPLRNEYDDDGRLVRHIDAAGNVITYGHDFVADREIMTNRLGHSRLLEYDGRGNVIREVDEEGRETLRTFDGEDNLLTLRNPLGHTATYTYTAGNDVASVTDPLGNVTSYTRDGAGRVLTKTDPRGKVTTHVYDADGNRLSTTDPLGHVTSRTHDSRGNVTAETDGTGATTTSTYDAQGLLTSRTDALGTVSTFAYDANGNPQSRTTSRTLPNGSTETVVRTFTHDAEGRQLTAADPTGAVSSTVYDALGQIVAEIDALGRRTDFTYDDFGRRTRIDLPDGTAESRTYDAEGRLVAFTDRAGRPTTVVYDKVGQHRETHFPDGAATLQAYDAAGRIASSTDERGSTATFAHDAAGRRIGVVDPAGQQTVFAYDAAGNQVSATDARGHTFTFEYDDVDRPVRTVFPDGTDRVVTYDALGRELSMTDQAGKTTEYAYDGLGRLVSVTDDLQQVTAYGYDELSHRISETDANGRTTRFEFDAAGRPTARVLPDGARETVAHDGVGQLVSKTDFLGRTIAFSYDGAGRIVTKTLPGGAAVNYSYTVTGRRAAVIDARGTTSYSYDARDRLLEMEYPDGRKLEYGYDAAGNRTSLMAHAGGQVLTTLFTYDPLDRLATVTDPDGRVYAHGYDANGNRTSVSYPNGVATSYAYDDLNRLTSLTTATSLGQVVQSYVYTLGPAGNRTRIDEQDGTARSYVYDDLHRLTQETVSDTSGTVYDTAFSHDPVGNRLSQVTTGTGAGTVGYTYDDRNRVLDEAGQSHTWDANGNLLAKSGEATYAWDSEDRLESVTLADGTLVVHTYDFDGVRVRTETTPPGGPARVVDYLVDKSGPLSHVVAETDGAGLLEVYYVRGDDLLAAISSAGIAYFHADGLGSVRALTDDTEVVTDRWTFNAFGELLDHQGSSENTYLFTGEPRDPSSDFYYHRARWMDPRLGRFASMDVFVGNDRAPATLHKYLYASANPVNRVDPSGLFDIGAALVSFAVVGLLAAMPVSAQGLRLRYADLTLTGTIVGEAKTFSYPKRTSKRYRVPTYRMFLEGTNNAGISVKEEYEVVRFGIQLERGWAVDDAKVVGLFEANDYTLTWFGSYTLHSTSTAGVGAWIIKGDHLIHDGPDLTPGSALVASKGCVEVCQVGKWEEMNDLIRELTGVDPSLGLNEALNLVSRMGRVRLKVEAARHPPRVEW